MSLEWDIWDWLSYQWHLGMRIQDPGNFADIWGHQIFQHLNKIFVYLDERL